MDFTRDASNGKSERNGAAVPAEGLPPAPDRYRILALALLTLVLVVLSAALAIPFLPALAWGVALAIIAWPLHTWMSSHIRWPGVAAVASTAIVVVVLLGPTLLVTYQVAAEAVVAADKMADNAGGNGLRDHAAQVPFVGKALDWLEGMGVDPEEEGRNAVKKYIGTPSSLVESWMGAAVQFGVAVFVLYFFFRDRASLLRGVRNLLPLSRDESDRVFKRVADSVHANVHATLVTSLIDGVGGGLMFWLLGLPAPMLWGAVMFIVSILPVIGTPVIWIPAAAFLAMSGNWLGAVALVTWGVVEWFVVDNVIYVRIAGERMRMHDVPALIAFLGGLAIFGLSGMILGPATLAVTEALLQVWRQRLAAADEGHDPTAMVGNGQPADRGVIAPQI